MMINRKNNRESFFIHIINFFKKNIFIYLIFLTFNYVYAYEITDKSIILRDDKGNTFSLLMDSETVKSYLGEPKELVMSKDSDGDISGYVYDGIEFYVDNLLKNQREKYLVWTILVENPNYLITFKNFRINETRFQDVSSFFNVSNGQIYSKYSPDELNLLCWFSVEQYMPPDTEDVQKYGDFLIVLTFDSKTQILKKCQLSIDYGI